MCELGLRPGGYEGTKRLVGRIELKRGLKALSAALTRTQAESTESKTQEGKAEISKAWSEQEVDNLMQGVAMCRGEIVSGRGGGGDIGKDADFSEEAFREGLMLAFDDRGNTMDRDVADGLKVLHLCEKLEVRPERSGIMLPPIC